jgi:hypothetical protein
MTTKLGHLGHPRIAIALVWFLPANSRADTAPNDAPPAPEPIPVEDIEFVREMTGMEPGELLLRMQAIAERLRKDPAGMREEFVRLMDGDEIAAEEVIQLIRAAEPGNDNGDDDREEPTGEGAEILDFDRPDDKGSPDDDGVEEP